MGQSTDLANRIFDRLGQIPETPSATALGQQWGLATERDVLNLTRFRENLPLHESDLVELIKIITGDGHHEQDLGSGPAAPADSAPSRARDTPAAVANLYANWSTISSTVIRTVKYAVGLVLNTHGGRRTIASIVRDATSYSINTLADITMTTAAKVNQVKLEKDVELAEIHRLISQLRSDSNADKASLESEIAALKLDIKYLKSEKAARDTEVEKLTSEVAELGQAHNWVWCPAALMDAVLVWRRKRGSWHQSRLITGFDVLL
ncbi:hypothetical protein Micbo1qcDRAFT_204475 [Microdochium bolleyi]|uniref:Uncharacterized protein n=1 Tax=Microdochium bolleyi TaxID=196109 RepID=A0A136J1S9_9PEZI|nr:hypothetical protein Micbo1qcDRAFT_204475 [Microdochium bolleyi]